MAQISFQTGRSPVDVPDGSNLMRSLQKAGVPVASSCGGEGACLNCVIQIVEGRENLSPETDFEKDLREINDVPSDSRISCQSQVLGNIKVHTEYW